MPVIRYRRTSNPPTPKVGAGVDVEVGAVTKILWRYDVRTDPYGASPTDPPDMVFNQVLWVTGEAPPVVSVP